MAREKVYVNMVIAGELLGVSRQRVHQLVQRGTLPAKPAPIRGSRILRRWVIPLDKVMEYAAYLGRPDKAERRLFEIAQGSPWLRSSLPKYYAIGGFYNGTKID